MGGNDARLQKSPSPIAISGKDLHRFHFKRDRLNLTFTKKKIEPSDLNQQILVGELK